MAKIVPPFIRSPYNYDTAAVSDETGLSCPEPTLAVQSERDDADINVIVKRFGLTGSLPSGVRVPTYGDFTGTSDYQSALNLIMAADDAFMSMPADVRARFNNNPAAFVEFVNDDKNYDEAVKLGVVIPRSGADSGSQAVPASSADAAPSTGS